MPIRFRCAYCNQLMGIARRKAGSVVRCPNCAGQVIVPSPVSEQPAPRQLAPQQLAPQQPAPAPALFEGSDFDKLFEPNTLGSPQAPQPQAPQPIVSPQPVSIPQPQPHSDPLSPAFDVESVPASTYFGPGILLTPVKLTVLSVTVVILLGVAFLIGFLVGRA
jgi:hypothetical protein